ncbi:hypothetical protein ABZW30_23390 [Kitasatospora sp. NPDC004669]|uniref:hypothetical protein n=1 Tax=Kitasatospora sp. NPDC004669 TaxID=3154555 RepID=UPI0033BBB2C2
MRSDMQLPGHVALRAYVHSRRAWVAQYLGPAVTWLQEEHGFLEVSLRRGWLHGPHLELQVHDHVDREIPWEPVLHRLRRGCDAVEAEPVTEADYLRKAERLGALERVPPPYLPLYEHGTVLELTAEQVRRWDSGLDRLRGSAMARMTAPLLMTAGITDEAEFKRELASAFAAVVGIHPAGLEHGCFSLRSHVESFLQWTPHADRLREEFARRLATDGDLVEAAVRGALAGSGSATANGWRAAAAYSAGLFDAAVASGALDYAAVQHMAVGDQTAPRIETAFSGKSLRRPDELSEFHRTVGGTGVLDNPPGWFTSFRVVINLFYQQLPILDVSPMTRLYLCYAVSEAVDRVTGRDWRDRLEPMKDSYQPRDLNADLGRLPGNAQG